MTTTPDRTTEIWTNPTGTFFGGNRYIWFVLPPHVRRPEAIDEQEVRRRYDGQPYESDCIHHGWATTFRQARRRARRHLNKPAPTPKPRPRLVERTPA